ncbi:CpsD/CapB family tyrosine-protein kinase [Aquibacillus salsiterrae]|uniref:non-specific protein-tyrosine kinase n=1 Tax=Aquibacillus salsiterrae TaxID=2950439 RepID=A0A9X3WFR6_9BACI|nr:CpsD/CapB family tyrosine-protein kinase [Aquibacillus salsiterrae]MDC3416614.1 CpsD/CapB family tyrosine-protein kinase [Aquibacillus salsiterrae]
MFKKKRAKKVSTNRHLISKINPKSPITEQYRTIRTNLQFASVDKPLETMLVTSPGPAEGKSSTVANLATVFAQQGKKVLVIDADMRKPTLHYTFQLDNRNGLSSVLVGETDLKAAIEQSGVDNLELLTCGPIPPNPSELLGSKAMAKLIEDAKQNYDLVMFDTPPVLAVTDAQILANSCDGTVLVVRSKQTENEAAEKAHELLKHAKAKVLGVVLNDRVQKKGSYYYYYQ